MIDYAIYTGKDLLSFVDDIARLRIEVFKEWPYRYDGTLENEAKYLKKFISSDEGFCVVAKDAEKVIGISTALPLKDEEEKMQAPFIKKGYNPDDFFYLSETVLQKEYRGSGIGGKLVEMRESKASQNSKYTHLTVAAIERGQVPPNSSKDLSQSRRAKGFTRDPELIVWYAWKDVGADEETTKPLIFWVKPLQEFHE